MTVKKVLVFGTFDGLHKGHLSLFSQAKRWAKKLPGSGQVYLVVVVARDLTVKKVKNHLPKFSQEERLKRVNKCHLVNEAQLGNSRSYYKKIKEIKPQMICLGYDQSSFTDNLEKEIEKMNLKIIIKRLRALKPKQYKSSIINKKPA